METPEQFPNHINSQEQKEEVIHPEIADLQEPLENLLSQLKPKIEQGAYGLLIGDEASGRIPTLILDNIINNIYREKHYSPPKTIFIAGGYGARPIPKKIEDIEEHLIKVERSALEIKDRETLIVTDTIETGEHLRPLVTALANKNIAYEIATLGFISAEYELPDMEKMLGGKIYSYNNFVPNIYEMHQLGGTKKSPESVLSRAIYPFNSSLVIEARNDIKILTTRLLKYYNDLNQN